MVSSIEQRRASLEERRRLSAERQRQQDGSPRGSPGDGCLLIASCNPLPSALSEERVALSRAGRSAVKTATLLLVCASITAEPDMRTLAALAYMLTRLIAQKCSSPLSSGLEHSLPCAMIMTEAHTTCGRVWRRDAKVSSHRSVAAARHRHAAGAVSFGGVGVPGPVHVGCGGDGVTAAGRHRRQAQAVTLAGAQARRSVGAL